MLLSQHAKAAGNASCGLVFGGRGCLQNISSSGTAWMDALHTVLVVRVVAATTWQACCSAS